MLVTLTGLMTPVSHSLLAVASGMLADASRRQARLPRRDGQGGPHLADEPAAAVDRPGGQPGQRARVGPGDLRHAKLAQQGHRDCRSRPLGAVLYLYLSGP